MRSSWLASSTKRRSARSRLEAAEHVVERHREAAELVVGGGSASRSVGSVAVTAEASHASLDRGERPPRDPVARQRREEQAPGHRSGGAARRFASDSSRSSSVAPTTASSARRPRSVRSDCEPARRARPLDRAQPSASHRQRRRARPLAATGCLRLGGGEARPCRPADDLRKAVLGIECLRPDRRPPLRPRLAWRGQRRGARACRPPPRRAGPASGDR